MKGLSGHTPVDESRNDRAHPVWAFGRLLAEAACLVMALGVLTSHAADPLPPDIKKIKDRGKLIVAQCSVVQPGFYWFHDRGMHDDKSFFRYQGRKLVGAEIGMAMKIADELGVGLEFNRSAGDFNSTCLQVVRGQADIALSKLSITLQRAQHVRFTRPYVVLGMGMIVNRLQEAKAGTNSSLWDLCNRPSARIGVWKGTSHEGMARELFPRADIRLYDSFEDLLPAVGNGDLLASLGEDFEVKLRLHQEPKWAMWVRYIQVPGKSDPIAIAVSPDSPNLLAFLNLFLEYGDVKIDIEDLLQKTKEHLVDKYSLPGAGAGK